jgi:hypothetical protein
VLRHEITHALVHESIGNLPTPLNEGLAGYFARYRTAGTGGEVVVGAGPAALQRAAASSDPGEALVDLLAREGAAFYAADTAVSSRDSRYLRAYALVALLMGDAQGARGTRRRAGGAARRAVPPGRRRAGAGRGVSRWVGGPGARLERLHAGTAGYGADVLTARGEERSRLDARSAAGGAVAWVRQVR